MQIRKHKEKFVMYVRHGRLGIIALAIAFYLLVIGINYSILECEGNTCNLYRQKGLFGNKILEMDFYRSDVYNFELTKSIYNSGTNSRSKARKSSLHDEYKMILYLKNGETVVLPFKSYDSPQRMYEIYSNIKSTAQYKIDGRYEIFKMPL